jgi:IclR family pca regulon transcriptional regulator
MAVMSVFAGPRREFGVTEIADLLELNKSTVHRFVSTLETLGYLEQNETTKKYRLGLRTMELGYAAINSVELSKAARPYLERLRDESGHSTNLAVLDDVDIVFMGVEVAKPFDIYIPLATRLPAYCTALGKAQLAFLSDDVLEARLSRIDFQPRARRTITTPHRLLEDLMQVRSCGFAVNHEESETGLSAIAAPVRSCSGEVKAAMSVTFVPSIGPRATREAAPMVVRAAELVSSKLGFFRT